MEEKMVLYHFEELIKTLITLSFSAEKQKFIIGIGNVADELVIDFDTHFNEKLAILYIEIGMLSTNDIMKLNEYNKVLNEKCFSQEADFFTDFEELIINPVWEEIRYESSRLLKSLNKDNLDIEVTREVTNNVEWTKTKLIQIN
ncbi:hypothetical protein [Paenibacillus sp. V4I5]|uniref:hypothetical protein n=1 Tax=Paenibacillus sp. V4I5 TaxID=3042306 RepID=UPI0027930898|nr:hypothetical protein [Paenibacillus sp. V4I5]MDQ0913888.1 hypothetical protein [Paenibacillus sp. V4I5]